MPRPYGPNTIMTSIAQYLYTYSVTAVRVSRPGNIGPVLIDLDRSEHQPGYKGVSLSTDPAWVFCSPMSWNPDNKRALWVEIRRGTNELRLRKARLLDYAPSLPIPGAVTTDDIPYGVKDLTQLATMTSDYDGRIPGKSAGYIEFKSSVAHSGYSGASSVRYVSFSDDGKNVYDGYESFAYNYIGESRYEAKIKLTGPKPGDMDFRATFGPLSGKAPARLLFENDADGKPKSYGSVTYDALTLNIADYERD